MKITLPNIDLDEVAFLQYTSGSTSFPKGVMLTHQNIIHQCEWYARASHFTSESCSIGWVPYFHDYCLIVGIVNVLYGHGRLILMSPLTFLKKPSLWFEAVSRYKVTHTASPNFGYELILRKTAPEEMKNWDLSSLVVLQSSSEPVRYNTVMNIKETFQKCGLNPAAVQASYGLAEHTCGATCNGFKVLTVQADKGTIKICEPGRMTVDFTEFSVP